MQEHARDEKLRQRLQCCKPKFGKPEERFKQGISLQLCNAGVRHLREYHIAGGGGPYFGRWSLFIDFAGSTDSFWWGIECKAFIDTQSIAHGIGQSFLYKHAGLITYVILCFPEYLIEGADKELREHLEKSCESAGVILAHHNNILEKLISLGVKTGPDLFKYKYPELFVPPQTRRFTAAQKKHDEDWEVELSQITQGYKSGSLPEDDMKAIRFAESEVAA